MVALVEGSSMKTMTCRQLGGPCDVAHQGATADDVIKAQDRHLKDVVVAGDATHDEALKAMKRRWLHPKASMSWYKGVKTTFGALHEH
jgi:hypothetical protein